MGNEQSVTSSSPHSSSNSAFSFLTGSSNSKSKGIVVVSGNAKVEKLEDDVVYKRFQEIPRFLPILRHSIGKKDVPPNEIQHKMSSRSFFRMATRFQHHLKICATTVAADQANINAAVKTVEASTTAVVNKFEQRKKVFDDFAALIQEIVHLREEMYHVQLMFQRTVPIVEAMNELLVPSERLPPLALGRVLERTPVSTSASSSQESTPKHVYPPNFLSYRHEESTCIAPVEEVRVVDRTN